MAGGRINQTQFALLGLLDSKPRTGYELKQLIGCSIAHFWREGWGQIYPTLKKLESEKLLTRSVVKHGHRARQVYRITRAGRARLQAWLASPVSPEVPRNELLLKLFFGGIGSGTTAGAQGNAAGTSGVERCRRQVAVYREQQERLQAGYAALEAKLRATAQGHPHLPFWLITLSYGQCRAQAMCAWCDETLKTLAEFDRAERTETRPGDGIDCK
jgi:PadR family transcriptional regulator, regulatory protein AphA